MKNSSLVYTSLIFFFLFLMNSLSLLAQDVGGFWGDIKQRIEDKEFLHLSGSMQASIMLNHIEGINARTDPFSARLNAGLLVDVLGFKGPFSLAISDRNTVYRLPAYSFLGFSPSYKWIKLHIGDRSMNFSPYSLSGQSFRGLGMELSPGKWKIAFLQGVLNTSRIEDAGSIQGSTRPFARRARAIKVNREFENGELGLSLFHARDKVDLAMPLDSGQQSPKANLVLELTGARRIADRLDINFGVAHSILTRDLQAADVASNKGLNGSMLGLTTVNVSTASAQAVNLGAAYQLSAATLNFEYERINAGYQSLGTISFLNDIEQYALGGSTGLFKNKISLAGRLGVQRNGLSGSTLNSGARIISNLNIGANLTERFSGSVSVSNFNFTQRQRISTTPFVVVDSVVIVQSNFNTQLSLAYLLGAEKNASLSLLGAWQNATTANGDELGTAADSHFKSASLFYSFRHPDRGMSLSAGITWNASQSADFQTSLLSPSITLSSELIPEKLQLSGNFSLSYTDTEGLSSGRIMQGGLSAQYTLSDKQRIAMRGSWVESKIENVGSLNPAFSDLNLALNYSLSF